MKCEPSGRGVLGVYEAGQTGHAPTGSGRRAHSNVAVGSFEVNVNDGVLSLVRAAPDTAAVDLSAARGRVVDVTCRGGPSVGCAPVAPRPPTHAVALGGGRTLALDDVFGGSYDPSWQSELAGLLADVGLPY